MCVQKFFMFNLVSFPIIPALLVSLKPLAQSWSPCCRTHTHTHTHAYTPTWTYARPNTQVHNRNRHMHTLEPWFGFMFVGSRMSSTPRTGSPAVWEQKSQMSERLRKSERARERGQDRELAQRREERKLERKRWETFGQETRWRGRAMKTQGRDLEQREKKKRMETTKNRQRFRFDLLAVPTWSCHMRKCWKWRQRTNSVPLAQYKIQHMCVLVWSYSDSLDNNELPA